MKKILSFKVILYFMFVSAFTILLASCNNKAISESPKESQEVSYQDITPEAAMDRLKNGENIILLDVRTQEEYVDGHIENSLLIPVDVLENEVEDKILDKEVPIFVYCRSGNRSVTASKILINLGYKNVYNLGGIRDWPYEIVK